jgi:hypothetical protein
MPGSLALLVRLGAFFSLFFYTVAVLPSVARLASVALFFFFFYTVAILK